MYSRILVPLDGSATAGRGLREAIAIACGQKEKPRLVLLHVVGDSSMFVEMSAAAGCRAMLAGPRHVGDETLREAGQGCPF